MKFEKIDQLLRPLNRFIQNEATAGILLIASSAVAMIWANSPWQGTYHHLWEYELSISLGEFEITESLHGWINDGLMAMFFFVVGLELKRELIDGELANPRKALLPLVAAIGGMVFPALIYLMFNTGQPSSSGWGVPMATDIAFALGVLSFLGKRVPLSVKVFITVLAIADDLGAVLIIALFYTSNISITNLVIGAVFLVVLLMANYLGVRRSLFYGIVGISGLWIAFLMSGVHATIAGVLAAMAIPARAKIDEPGFVRHLKKYVGEFEQIPPNNVSLLEPAQLHIIGKIKRLTNEADTPLQRLEHRLQPFVLYGIMPLFALANAGISFNAVTLPDFVSPVSLGIFFGLVIGKSIGINGLSWLFLKLKWVSMPDGMSFKKLIGLSLLAGIGFTMSLFITNLAFTDPLFIAQARIGILVASLCAGTIGYFVLWKSTIQKD